MSTKPRANGPGTASEPWGQQQAAALEAPGLDQWEAAEGGK